MAEPPSLAARLVRALEARAVGVRVADVRVGLAYTAVRLEDGRCGVAFTFRDAASKCCSFRADPAPLAGRPARDLLALLALPSPIDAAVGLACANALANAGAGPALSGDVLDHLQIGADDDVGMVGHFAPMVAWVRERARSLTIFERVEAPDETVRPTTEAPEVLPRCDVVLITATSLVNHTIDGLLAHVGACRQVAVLGATTPLVPEAFAGTPVTLLSGIVVDQPVLALQVASEAGGTRRLRRCSHKVNVRIRD